MRGGVGYHLDGRFQIRFGRDRSPDAIEQLQSLRFFLEQARRLPAGPRKVEIRLDARHEFARRERLGQIVVGAGAQPVDLGLLAGAGGEQDHRDGLQSVIGTHRRQQTETVELRHHDVGQHERGRARARGAQRRFAVADRLHAIAGRDQQPFDVLPHVTIVVRQQHEVMTAVMRDRRPPDILRPRGREAIRCVPPPVEPGRSFLQIGLGANRGRERLRVAVDACARQVLGTEWQRDGEPAALALFAVDGDPAAVQPDQLLHQREPDAAAFDAAAAGAFDAMKAFEQPRQLLRRNAGTGVAHRDLGGTAVRTGPHLDRDFTLEGELERIGEKIEHDLLPHVAVDIDGFGQRGAVEAKPQAGPLHRRLERRSDIRRQP